MLITTEVIRHSLQYACEEMGIVVRNAAYSPNIKERLDHSCALFDAQGRMTAQAEHIPVHLGSLPWGLHRTLAYLAEQKRELTPGDMLAVNNPYLAGTHLNDITLIRPIFYQSKLVGYSANKAHHTDVGGRAPGSMSSESSELFQEGLILPPVRIMRDNSIDQDLMRIICANSRTPGARAGDLRAQIAGNLRGELRLHELLDRYGIETYEAAIERILDDSERRMRHALSSFAPGAYTATDVLEDADRRLPITVTLTLEGDHLSVDYTGTTPQVARPLNAVFGVTLAAVFYVLRAVTGADIPMNEGCFRPVRVIAPEGCLLNPRYPAPVAGGNVETSQRNADVLLQAWAMAAPDRIPASSGGTMTNLQVGGDGWAFYETLGTGMGARPGLDGIDGIQCNMTNTLNTPVEAMERIYPLLMTAYEFRSGSGGLGRWNGGDGLTRAWKLLAPRATVSLLGDRMIMPPPGLHGGEPGAPARYTLIRNGESIPLPAKTTFEMYEGDELILETPGGGGYGTPSLAPMTGD